MNSSFTDSNYTQLTEVYSKYKDKGLGFCALLSIFSIPVCVCVYLCTYVYENELCDPPVIDLVGISYLYDELNLKKKKKKKSALLPSFFVVYPCWIFLVTAIICGLMK